MESSGFIFAFLFTFSSIPLINYLSLKFNLVDKPEERKQHKKNIVRIGGLGIFLGIYFALFLLLKFNLVDIGNNNLLQPVLYIAPLFFLLGFIDDIKYLSPFSRLLFQFFLSIFVWSKGIQINTIILQIFDEIISIDLNTTTSLLITVFWIAGMINAINWMDGLDGLAAGIVSISSVGLIIIGIFNGNSDSVFLLITILGACFAFLIYNMYPAKILMGDGGSYLLGFFAASLSIYFPHNNINEFKSLDFSILLIFLIFIVPLLDMLVVILSRIKGGKSIFLPDRSHIHHRLIDLGFSHENTVLIIFSISQFFVSVAIALFISNYQYYLMFASTLLLITTFYSQFNLEDLFNFKLSPRKSIFK